MGRQSNMDGTPFWQQKHLNELTPEEWELLCDGCGRCCLIKLEDEDTGEIVHTRVACLLLNTRTCRCSQYEQRHEQVPDCVQLTPEGAESLNWLPETCAYRMIARGQDLEWWHPLISGTPDAVHAAGISIRRYAISEKRVKNGNFERFLLKWK